MPYVKAEDRQALLARYPSSPGELNFMLTTVIDEYVTTKGLNYQTINDILGALTGAQLEFYARVARPYEDTKIAANGDVYRPEHITAPVPDVGQTPVTCGCAGGGDCHCA